MTIFGSMQFAVTRNLSKNTCFFIIHFWKHLLSVFGLDFSIFFFTALLGALKTGENVTSTYLSKSEVEKTSIYQKSDPVLSRVGVERFKSLSSCCPRLPHIQDGDRNRAVVYCTCESQPEDDHLIENVCLLPFICKHLCHRLTRTYAVNKKEVSCRTQGVSWTKITFLFKCS